MARAAAVRLAAVTDPEVPATPLRQTRSRSSRCPDRISRSPTQGHRHRTGHRLRTDKPPCKEGAGMAPAVTAEATVAVAVSARAEEALLYRTVTAENRSLMHTEHQQCSSTPPLVHW